MNYGVCFTSGSDEILAEVLEGLQKEATEDSFYYTDFSSTDNVWVQHQVCVPPGKQALIFQVGNPVMQAFALTIEIYLK